MREKDIDPWLMTYIPVKNAVFKEHALKGSYRTYKSYTTKLEAVYCSTGDALLSHLDTS